MPSEPAPDVSARIWRRFGTVALWLFAIVPFGLAMLAALRAPRMHVLLDYWHVLAKITDDDGSLLLGHLTWVPATSGDDVISSRRFNGAP